MVHGASEPRAFFGQSSRVFHGVRMRPMKYTPASKLPGSADGDLARTDGIVGVFGG